MEKNLLFASSHYQKRNFLEAFCLSENERWKLLQILFAFGWILTLCIHCTVFWHKELLIHNVLFKIVIVCLTNISRSRLKSMTTSETNAADPFTHAKYKRKRKKPSSLSGFFFGLSNVFYAMKSIQLSCVAICWLPWL